MVRTARIREKPLEGFRTQSRDLGEQKIENFWKNQNFHIMVKKCPRKNFLFFQFFPDFLGLIQSLGKIMSVTANFRAKFQKFEIFDGFWGLYR